MKKLISMIAALLLTLTASAQFEQDKVYIGGALSGFNLSYSGLDKFNFGAQAHAGYLVEDNLMLLGTVNYQHNGNETESIWVLTANLCMRTIITMMSCLVLRWAMRIFLVAR